jgi:two-component system cell cycle sensor histidine kinase/response regulator CckA
MPAETILLADDEETIRSFVRITLSREGFQVIEAFDGVNALEQVAERGAPIDLLVTDIRMPRMDGIALARSVTDAYPQTPVLYISGYPFELRQELRELDRACASLSKPFTRQELLKAVQKCLAPRPNAGGE